MDGWRLPERGENMCGVAGREGKGTREGDAQESCHSSEKTPCVVCMLTVKRGHGDTTRGKVYISLVDFDIGTTRKDILSQRFNAENGRERA
jgi:hypothetical protein